MTTVVCVHWFPPISEDRIVTISIKHILGTGSTIEHMAKSVVQFHPLPHLFCFLYICLCDPLDSKTTWCCILHIPKPFDSPHNVRTVQPSLELLDKYWALAHLPGFRQKTNRFWVKFPLSYWRFCAGLKWINKYKRTLTIYKSSNIRYFIAQRPFTMSGSFTLPVICWPALSFSLASSCTDVWHSA